MSKMGARARLGSAGLALVLVTGLTSAGGLQVAAQDVPTLPDDDTLEDGPGLDLLERGTRLLMDRLLQELGPALNGFREGLEGLQGYHPPEMLPNGDIIIRRRTPLDDAIEAGPQDGVDL